MDKAVLVEKLGKKMYAKPDRRELAGDYFEALRHLMAEDEPAALRLNKELMKFCTRMTREGKDLDSRKFYFSLRKKTLLLDAKTCLDSFLQYLEFDRDPPVRYYMPRRNVLLPVVNELQRLTDDELDLLCISLAPGTGKSTLGIFYMTWIMGRWPEQPNLMSAHSDKLTRSFYDGVLSVLNDPDYLWADVFSGTKIAATNAKDETIDLNKEKRFKTLTCRSIGGSLTGATRCERLLLADDLVSGIEEALNKSRMDSLWDAYTNDLKTRKKEGCKELHISTRWSPILNSTPVLTTGGWKTHGELNIGDEVFGITGKPVTITNITEPVWCDMVLKTKRENIVCSKNHIWAVKSRPEHNAVVMTAEEIYNNGKHRSVGSINPIEYPQGAQLPIDPYWLGLWLGDGSSDAPVIRCYSKIREHCESTVYKYTISHNSGNLFYNYTKQGIRKKLNNLNLLQNKHIPDIYKRASVTERLELLAGLVDADGEKCTDCDRYRFSNSRPKLFDDFIELIIGLGFSFGSEEIVNVAGSIGINGSTRRSDCRRVRFKPTLDVPLKLQYKYVKPQKDYGRTITVEKSDVQGWGKCITTTAVDGIYLVGKTLIPTHNTHDPIGRLQRQYQDDERACFIAIPALNENDESNFDYKNGTGFSTKYFLDMRDSLDDVSWRCLFQQEPVERGTVVFPEDELNRYFELPAGREPDAVIAACDTAEKGADSTALAIAYIYGNDVFIHDVVFDNGLPAVTKPQCANKLIEHKVEIATFESNSAGEYYARDVDEIIKNHGGKVSIRTKRTVSNKMTRIEMASDHIIKNFYFKDKSLYATNSQYAAFMRELLSFTRTGTSKHDDAPDVLSLIHQEIRNMAGHAPAVIFRRPF